jgi:hypothetical protein
MSGVDRLALVSKILLDSRFLALKRENERLTLSLFWVDHSINTLKTLMAYANKKPGGPQCRCRCCLHAKRCVWRWRMYNDGRINDEPCIFGPWFETILQQHGLSFASSAKDDNLFRCAEDRESYPMPPASVHFLLITTETERAPAKARGTWVYGSKLWKAQTTQDPGLLNLTALFKTLGGEPDWLVVGNDYSDGTDDSW